MAEQPLEKEGSDAEAGEIKYYFSTLPADTPIKRLAELAHSRWAIEQYYEDGKGECGLDDYQGRRWDGLHRHLALSMLSYSFLMVQSVAAQEPDADITNPTPGRASCEASDEEVFFPLSAETNRAGDAQASTRVAVARPRALVHSHRPDQALPSLQKLTKQY